MFLHSQSRPLQRPLLWLLLPLVLCALVWGVKWRADHPTPTKLDLEMRALMLESSSVDFYHHSRISKGLYPYRERLSMDESKSFTNNLNLLPQKLNKGSIGVGLDKEIIQLHYFYDDPKKGRTQIYFSMDVESYDGEVYVDRSSNDKTHKLHPTTTRRWLKLLSNHPRIGPELRRRMQR